MDLVTFYIELQNQLEALEKTMKKMDSEKH